MELIVLLPQDDFCESARFRNMVHLAFQELERMSAETQNVSLRRITTAKELEPVLQSEQKLCDSKLLLLAAVGAAGINMELTAMLRLIRSCGRCMSGSFAGIILDGMSENWTKSVAREAALTLNQAGCGLIGRPLCEATGSLMNYLVISEVHQISLQEAYEYRVRELVQAIVHFRSNDRERKKILCVHSCNKKTSNTWNVWNRVKENLGDSFEIREISLRGGTVHDCAGCTFATCMYFSKKSSCFYGGTIVDEVYPALEQSDALVILSPNYNDAMSANLVAFVNRLTALYRKKPFSDKYLFAVIASGYSGGDIVAEQILGSLCMNKSFILPGEFSLQVTAMHPGSVELIPDIDRKILDYAENMKRVLCGTEDSGKSSPVYK